MKFFSLLLGVTCAMAAAAWAAVAQSALTPEACKRHFAQDPSRRQMCLREASQPQAAVVPQAAANGAWSDPLPQLQLIFGFYDRRFAAYNGGQEHMGLDLSAAAGTPVYAICDGAVALTKTDRPEIIQAVLVIEHECAQPLGKVYAYYGHIQSDLARGDRVAAGDTIGVVREWPGNGHLHLGLSRQLVDEQWGLMPRGTSLQEIEAQGWIDPLNYFTPGAPPPAAGNGLKRVAPQAPVYRQHRAGNIAGQRRR